MRFVRNSGSSLLRVTRLGVALPLAGEPALLGLRSLTRSGGRVRMSRPTSTCMHLRA